MKKVAAFLMALAMAIPIFAQPVCAAACGGDPGGGEYCCCGPKVAPGDGLASYTSIPCCPPGAARSDLVDLDGAVPSVQTTAAGTTGPGFSTPALAAATIGAPALRASFTAPLAEFRPPGTPLYLLASTLRL